MGPIALAVALAAAGAGCGRPTEIVLRLETPAPAPTQVQVRLHRGRPFPDNPATTPPWVVPLLDGADLLLLVTPQGSETALSLLPGKDAGADLRVTVSAAPWTVDPPGAVDLTFVDGQSKEARFVIGAPLPDLGAPPDLLPPRG